MIAPGTRTRAAQAWRVLSTELNGDADATARRLFAVPVLLRGDVLDQLVADGLTAGGEELVTLIRRVQERLAAQPDRYPIGPGPVEALWADVDAGVRSVQQATVAAAHLQVTEALTPGYVEELLTSLRPLAAEYDTWRQARDRGRIALAAVDACDRRAEPAMRRARCFGVLRWAHGLLISVPDRALLEEADLLGQELLRIAPERAADIHFQLAATWGDPYTAGRNNAGYDQQLFGWRERGRYELGQVDGRDQAGWQMPEPVPALDTAVGHWRAAKELAPDEPTVLAGFAETSQWRAMLAEEEASPEVAEAVRHGLELLDPDDPAQAALRMRYVMLATLAGIPGPESALPDLDADDLLATCGADSGQMVMRAVLAARDTDPAAALATLERYRELLADPERLNDHDYRMLAQYTGRILNRVHGSPLAEEEIPADGDFGEFATGVLERVLADDPGPTRIAAALVALATRSVPVNAELVGLQLLRISRERAPLFAKRYEWAYRVLEAELLLGAGVNAYEADTYNESLRMYMRALSAWVALERVEPVRDLLGRLVHIAYGADETAALELLGGLVTAAPTLVARLGDDLEDRLTRVFAGILGGLIERDELNSEVVWFLLQFAKGLRNAMLLDRREAVPLRQDPQAAELLKRLTPEDDPAGAAAAPGGKQALDLRLAFERRRRRVSLADLPAPDVLDLAQARHALDHRTVLMSTLTVVGSDGRPARVAFLVWDDDQVLTSTGPLDPAGHLPWMPDAVLPVLADLRKAGRDHLCVVADGGLQAESWNLLGTGTWCLADEWIVTMLPHPHLLWRSRGRRSVTRPAATPVLAVGMGHATSGRVPLPDAVAEARTIADRLGGIVLPDAAATEEAFRQGAPTARYVHVATHGDFDPSTPAFHALALHPAPGDDGLLTAWEVAELDLSSVRLVTLSACETARMSVEAGDNLDGLPIAFLAAGAGAVVGTNIEIDSATARFFFERFYAQLAGEVDLRDALRTAQVATRAQYPDTADWASFYFHGDWR